VSTSGPIVSAPLVWVELITSAVDRASDFYGAVLGWKPSREPRSVDLVVFLDQARIAGPICGIRPRSPSDPIPVGTEPPVLDRWSVRLSPPRPPAAADPGSDQLLRPRAPGPRLGRWQVPNSLCYAELRTPDVDGARAWMERRLDSVFASAPKSASDATSVSTGDPSKTILLSSAVEPGRAIAAIVDEPEQALAGWYPCVQVASLASALSAADAAGALGATDRPVPAGCPGTAAAELVDPGGAHIVLVEHGPAHGRRG
jgi:catechol 2,3-dioxygenase-like lactoylglutathione lyase family enzyme